MKRKNQLGMTLIELLIAMVIIGILSAIAIPSYQSYVVRANRTAAQAFMQDIASKEQQYLLDARTYTNQITDQLKLSPPSDVNANYTFTVDPATATAFTITASPRAGTKQAGDGNLTLDHLGNRAPADKWTK